MPVHLLDHRCRYREWRARATSESRPDPEYRSKQASTPVDAPGESTDRTLLADTPEYRRPSRRVDDLRRGQPPARLAVLPTGLLGDACEVMVT